MKAIIIAAGSAIRLGKKTEKLPKGLLKINGTSIIERQLSLFKQNGLSDIVIITGPYSEKFTFSDVTYVSDENYENHEVLSSLMEAQEYINGDVLISYSDILFDESILKIMINSQASIGIGVDLNWEKAYLGRTQHPKSEADNVLIQNQQILNIKKNIIAAKANQQLGEFIGLVKLNSEGASIFVNKFNELESNHKGTFHDAPSLEKAYFTDIFKELIDSSILITPIIVEGKWCEIDTIQDLENAARNFN